MLQKFVRGFLLLSFLMLSTAQFVYATPFDINLSLTGFTTAQTAIFEDAEDYWESVISGYQTGITTITSLKINAEAVDIDGLGNILGSGGPTWITTEGGYTLSTEGDMSYDSADLAVMEDWDLYDTIVHEIAHVIGFGTLWEENNVYIDGSYKYTGATALAAYQAEFGVPGASFIPVENGGGDGTAGAHWELDKFPGEMMTGWSMLNPAYVSQTTLASFVDIGYVLAEQTSVPEPATFFLFGLGLLGLSGLNRRKS
ncbi:leishmanolysin-related zinc metalloendopeptidase [uncultured Desulfobacter sp.]|uniref:leishmanolysin-related zinc metalloendopeptidase n=1 Tax=uncultured Desulfobacter sp. TaxID=240139 RepID=UPI0029F4DC41|nr:leishmanolysin-related zinc metalloendopeptidase [uncultured Desulfobacter sp.]